MLKSIATVALKGALIEKQANMLQMGADSSARSLVLQAEVS